jgi:hypothetical protein
METPVIDVIYRILKINPVCEWYSERELFEGKLLKCIEIFQTNNSAGFIFINQSDCPAGYDSSFAFCLTGPKMAFG